ncbi:cytochrome P450 CYP82H23-like isoform X1 [Punica granatum]|uniref:Cytochrome P450 CYP82H23-like isoform X1 n=1 Tax=Punica granatum TaxID=22663 RepID=A0A6P8BV65_PUNGR|nr:cytochrome P450 CYP82H23-like isoform X1 [Punica granatum]
MDHLLSLLLFVLALCPLTLALHGRIFRRFGSAALKRSNHSELLQPRPSGAWPLVGHLHLLWGREPAFRKFAAMADRYGLVFSLRVGLCRLVVVSGSEAARECLVVNDRVLGTRPDIAVGRYIGYDNAIFALAPTGPYWREIRKITALKLLSSHRVERLLHVRASKIASFMADLLSRSQHDSLVIPIDKQFKHLTFNINLRIIARKKFSDAEFGKAGSDACRFKKAIEDFLYLSGVFVLSDMIPWLEWADIQGHVKAMKETGKELDYVLDKWLKEHIERRKQRGKHEIDDKEADNLMEILLERLTESEPMFFGRDRETVIKATALHQVGQRIICLEGKIRTWGMSVVKTEPNALSITNLLDRSLGFEV